MFKFQLDLFHSLLLQLSRLPVDVLPVLVGRASGVSMRHRNPPFIFRYKNRLNFTLFETVEWQFRV